jgi:ATP-dependent exoDNAse (exonuclease V) alpha subunit
MSTIFASDKTGGGTLLTVTRLAKNWRTDCQGIRDLCADMLKENAETLSARLPAYVKSGGVRIEVCDRNNRAVKAAMIYAELIDRNVSPDEIAILGPHNGGDEAGVRAANLAVRDVLGLDPRNIVKGEQLIVVKNNYKAPSIHDVDELSIIYNGERCYVTVRGLDYLHLEFPRNSEGIIRRVCLLTQEGRGTAHSQLPEGTEFGSAFSIHKAQGSQFDFVIMLAERGYNKGVVQGSNVYTGISRARKQIIIVGQLDDFVQAAATSEIPRETLLKGLLQAPSKGVK